MRTPLDHQGLLSGPEIIVAASPATVDDDELLAELKQAAGAGNFTLARALLTAGRNIDVRVTGGAEEAIRSVDLVDKTTTTNQGYIRFD